MDKVHTIHAMIKLLLSQYQNVAGKVYVTLSRTKVPSNI